MEEQPIWSTLLLAHIVSRDPMSTTYRNFCHIKEVFGLDPWDFSSQRIKMKLPVNNIPRNQKWRIGLLSNLKKMKGESKLNVEDSTRSCAMQYLTTFSCHPLWVTLTPKLFKGFSLFGDGLINIILQYFILYLED